MAFLAIPIACAATVLIYLAFTRLQAWVRRRQCPGADMANIQDGEP